MKRLWQRYVEKVDAASLRERVMIFAAAALVLVVVMNALLIEPQLAVQRRLTREVAQRQGEIRMMQEQLQKLALTRQSSPDEVNQRRLLALRQSIAAVERRLADEQRKFAPPEQVGALLDQMLSRNRRLQLVDMRTLPVANLAGATAGGATETEKLAATKAVPEKAGAKPSVPTAGSQIYRHGVEITVSGSYLDLLAYLKDLEKLPSQLYWGKIELSTASPPQVTLKLSVYTLSLDLSWLVV